MQTTRFPGTHPQALPVMVGGVLILIYQMKIYLKISDVIKKILELTIFLKKHYNVINKFIRKGNKIYEWVFYIIQY